MKINQLKHFQLNTGECIDTIEPNSSSTSRPSRTRAETNLPVQNYQSTSSIALKPVSRSESCDKIKTKQTKPCTSKVKSHRNKSVTSLQFVSNV